MTYDRWEFRYETDVGPAALLKRIEPFGKEGWELVSVVFDGKRFQAFLKRPSDAGDDTASLP